MSNHQGEPIVSNTEIDTFERDGVVCLRGRFDLAWIDTLAKGLERNFTDPGPDGTVYTPAGKPGGFYDDYCNWQRIPQYKDFVCHSPAGEIVSRLMRSDFARIYHDHVLVKEPGTQEVTPWHHDLPYYGLEGEKLCSIWLPLDAVPQSICPEFVAGSHRSGVMYYPRKFISHNDYSGGVPGYESIPDIDGDRGGYDLRSWELQLGDCIVFHMRTIHGAPATAQVKSRRRGFSTRWLGDDAVFATRAWQTSPPFSEVSLEPGEPMDSPIFPIVWPMQ